jgi:hypothetical protein
MGNETLNLERKQQKDLAEHKPEFVKVQYLGLFIYIFMLPTANFM